MLYKIWVFFHRTSSPVMSYFSLLSHLLSLLFLLLWSQNFIPWYLTLPVATRLTPTPLPSTCGCTLPENWGKLRDIQTHIRAFWPALALHAGYEDQGNYLLMGTLFCKAHGWIYNQEENIFASKLASQRYRHCSEVRCIAMSWHVLSKIHHSQM